MPLSLLKSFDNEDKWVQTRVMLEKNDESNQTLARTHSMANAVAIMATRKMYFAAAIASMHLCPAGHFQVLRGILQYPCGGGL